MADPCISLLTQQAHRVSGPQLLVADENLTGSELQSLAMENITLVTNRYDLFEQAKISGLTSHYSDFDFSAFPDHSFDQVLYRVSKEKPVTHHVINSAHRLLKHNGSLVLTGEKSDGIKTYANKAGQLFGDNSTSKKQGTAYLAVIHSTNSCQDSSGQPLLEDQNYRRLRPAITVYDQMLYSKPGLFGWNKIDQGSAFLADYFPALFASTDKTSTNILDLGCGYGYLSAMIHHYTRSHNMTAHIIATDNNAAAIAACSRNFALLGIEGEVIAGNCADTIDQTFDAIVCNPPFHQGFDVDNQLTQRFVDSSYRHLNTGGKALFVANRFVAIEKCAEKLFGIKRLAENKGFKLILLSKR